MIGAIFFLTSRGDVVLSRCYRDNFVVRTVTDTFRDEVIATKLSERSPVNVVDKVSFAHMKFDNILLVAASRYNVNCFLVFQYMQRLMQTLYDYYGTIDEMTLKDNFVSIQQIMDETMDYGYPQITDSALLKRFIATGGTKAGKLRPFEAELITIKATGKIPWRSEGIVYRINELFVDVVEDVNMLISQSGDVLQREVLGRVVVKCFLSGMPECQMVLNDKGLLTAQDAGSVSAAPPPPGGEAAAAASASPEASTGSSSAVALDGITFHPCVRLSALDVEKAISFVPPDGDFILMRYRSSDNLQPPMKIAFSRAKEVSRTRIEIDFHLQCLVPSPLCASNVVVKIPCPSTTSNVKVRVAVGKAKYEPTEQAILWKIKQIEGGATTAFSAEVNMIGLTLSTASGGLSDITTADGSWGRPPISIQFTTEMYTASGLRVERLTVVEPRLHYTPKKWVRYVSTGGQYQCRI